MIFFHHFQQAMQKPNRTLLPITQFIDFFTNADEIWENQKKIRKMLDIAGGEDDIV